MTGSTAIRTSLIAVLVLLPVAYFSLLWLTFYWADMGAKYDWEATGRHMVVSGIGIFIAEFLFAIALLGNLMSGTKAQAPTHAQPTVVVHLSRTEPSPRRSGQCLLVGAVLAGLVGGGLAALFFTKRCDQR